MTNTKHFEQIVWIATNFMLKKFHFDLLDDWDDWFTSFEELRVPCLARFEPNSCEEVFPTRSKLAYPLQIYEIYPFFPPAAGKNISFFTLLGFTLPKFWIRESGRAGLRNIDSSVSVLTYRCVYGEKHWILLLLQLLVTCFHQQTRTPQYFIQFVNFYKNAFLYK